MQSGYETVILIDSHPSGQQPGSITVLEFDLHDGSAWLNFNRVVELHAMNPMNVLNMAASV
jgi:Ni,Fe-hydrogenase maturation factor